MQILRNKNELRAWVSMQRMERNTIAFVPTMGALHDGHLSLVRLGQQKCTRCIASIFVNPKQFGKGEDFESYPRPLEKDIAALETTRVSALYLPDALEMYPEPFHTVVSVSPMKSILEGEFRPHFFDGVATVVTKLLLQLLPDVALFGEKDYQQLQIIKTMVKDLDIPVQIFGGPTLRESDGLAMASRNVYLSAEERKKAPALYQALEYCRLEIMKQSKPVFEILEAGKKKIAEAGFDSVDYLEYRDSESLDTITSPDKPGRLLAAARLGKTRLIDNIAVERVMP